VDSQLHRELYRELGASLFASLYGWGDPGLIDSGSGCNIEPEVSIGYCREEAAEDLYA
jgi:hypothetical protein